jgi:2'-deoxynucleoside 5'-phosphate N-hydrolase
MIVYCAGPIRGELTYQNYYKEIIEYISELGHTPLSELNTLFKSAIPLSDKQIYKRDIKWIESSAVMVAEVSGGSTGSGYEIAYALYHKKIPVLCLYEKNSSSVSAMIKGNNNPLLTLKGYTGSEDLKKCIKSFLKKNP